MKTIVISIVKEALFWLGRTLVRAAQDKTLQEAIKAAVLAVEEASANDPSMDSIKKMEEVLSVIKTSGAQALKNETTASLRAKVETTVSDLANKGLLKVSKALDKIEKKL